MVITGVPTGTIVPFAGVQARLAQLVGKGWLKCDGSLVSEKDYPELFVAIGTTYGGDGKPNFALPDLRSMVLRGVDDGTNRDAGAPGRFRQGTNRVIGPMVGSWQPDQLLATGFSPTDTETHSKNVVVYYLIASGEQKAPVPPDPPPYVWSAIMAATLLADGTILGVGTDNQLYARPSLAGPWNQISNSGPVIAVSQLSDGRILGLKTDNLLRTRDSLTSPWVDIPGSGAVKAVTVLADGTILGVGMNNTLYTRSTLTSPWGQVPSSGDVIGILQRPDGKFVGVGTDQHLYVRTTLGSGWQLIPDSGSFIAVAQLAYGVILGIDTNRQLFTRASLTSRWIQV